MVNVIVNVDDGNSPKKSLLKQFNIAFAEGNVKFIIANVTDDIVWQIVGANTIRGRADFSVALKKIKYEDNAEVTVHKMITHGKEAAVNGEIVMTNGKRYAFCDFYDFRGNVIKAITSYNIEMQ